MKHLEEAIEAAYEAHIMSLYKALSDSMLAANESEAGMADAQERFRHGLAFAADVRARARAAAGL